jgi:hypothetical protein
MRRLIKKAAKMFAMDIPDLPPQEAPVVIAQASQTQKGSDATLGICHLIENPPASPDSAGNALGPVTEVWGYFKRQKRFTRQQLTAEMYNAAKVTIPEQPKHGRLEDLGRGDYYYHPPPGYFGADQATFVVEMGGLSVKLVYFFNVLSFVPGGNDAYDPHNERKYCPQGKGRMWNISLDTNGRKGATSRS